MATDLTAIATPEAFLNLVEFRRSCRAFDPNRPVTDDQIQFMLEAARWAPSAGNGQPWEFVVVRDADTRAKLLAHYDKQRQEKREIEMALRPGTPGSGLPGLRFVHVPCLIVVVGDRRVERAYPIRTREDKGYRHFISGLANAVLLIHLAAHSLGLGACYVSDVGSPYMAAMTKALLDIPDELVAYEMVAVGYPTQRPDPKPRRPLSEMVHYERYDRTRYRDEDTFNAFIHAQTRTGTWGKTLKKS